MVRRVNSPILSTGSGKVRFLIVLLRREGGGGRGELEVGWRRAFIGKR